MPPLFSIITTNYNHEKYLNRNFESVLRQNFDSYEHLLIDDGSTDKSIELMEAYELQSNKVRIFRHERNLGPGPGTATGVKNSSGSYISFLSADDELEKNLFSLICSIIEKNPNTALICGHIKMISDNNKNVHLRKFFNCNEPTFIEPNELAKYIKRGLYIVNGGGSFVSKSALLKTPFDHPLLRWHSDSLSFNMIGLEHGLWYVPEALHKYHLTGTNYSFGALCYSNQEKVISYSLDLLNTETYIHIKQKFIDSYFFASYPLMATFCFKNYNKYLEFVNLQLLIYSLKVYLFRIIKKYSPKFIFKIYIFFLSL